MSKLDDLNAYLSSYASAYREKYSLASDAEVTILFAGKDTQLQILVNPIEPVAIGTNYDFEYWYNGTDLRHWQSAVPDVSAGTNNTYFVIGDFDAAFTGLSILSERMDVSAESQPQQLTLSQKGDIIVHDGSNDQRLAVGDDGESQVLTPDSSTDLGVKWVTIRDLLSPGTTEMTWMGTWESGTNYEIGDVVNDSRYVYVAKQNSVGKMPKTEVTYWEVMSHYPTNTVEIAGTWNASLGTFPESSRVGALYECTVGGTIDNVTYTEGDLIIAKTENASTTAASGWHKIDNGHPISVDDTFAAATDVEVPSTLAVKTFVDSYTGGNPVPALSLDDTFATANDVSVSSSEAIKAYADSIKGAAEGLVRYDLTANETITTGSVVRMTTNGLILADRSVPQAGHGVVPMIDGVDATYNTGDSVPVQFAGVSYIKGVLPGSMIGAPAYLDVSGGVVLQTEPSAAGNIKQTIGTYLGSQMYALNIGVPEQL